MRPRSARIGELAVNDPANLEPAPHISAATRCDFDSCGVRAVIVHEDDDVMVTLRGHLDMQSAPDLRHRLRQLLQLPIKTMTLDLGEVDFIDSSGIALLYTARRDAKDTSVAFNLAPGHGPAIRVLDVAGVEVPVRSSRGAEHPEGFD